MLDGNVKRIASRLFLLAINNEQEYERKLEEKIYSIGVQTIEQAKERNNRQNKQIALTQSNKIYGEINQALMDLGRELCHPKNPNCNSCPLFSICLAGKKKINRTLSFKKRKTKKYNCSFSFFSIRN